MAGVDAVRLNPVTSSAKANAKTQSNEKNKEAVATGVGATAAATKAAGKRGLQSQAGEKAIGKVMDAVSNSTKDITRNAKEAKTLWAKFKLDVGKYTTQLNGYIDRFKDKTFVGAIVKSSITKSLMKFFGGALAFFVLVTGVNKAVRTGVIAFGDFKSQYNEMFGKK